MKRDRQNRLPSDRVLAKRFCKGMICDYPAEDVFRAIHSFDLPYNSIAIPIKLGFVDAFCVNFDAFCYLSKHRTELELSSFLSDPNEFMRKAGVICQPPLDNMTAAIMCAMLEDEMYEALTSPDLEAVMYLLLTDKGEQWRLRHPERYPSNVINTKYLPPVESYPSLVTDRMIANGFNRALLGNVFSIRRFFTAEE